MANKYFTLAVGLVLLVSGTGICGDQGLVCSWGFEKADGHYVVDTVVGVKDKLLGQYRYVPGVKGDSVVFDGCTSYVVRSADKVPVLTNALSIEAWIAPQTYSWNWTGIVSQATEDSKDRIFFGIDCEGRIGFRLNLNGKVEEVKTEKVLDLLKWSHIAATFDQNDGMKIYLNGQLKASKSVKGSLVTGGGDLYLGKNQLKMAPERTERDASESIKSEMIFDGLIDEVKVYNRCMSGEEILADYDSSKPKVKQPLQYRKMPTGPKGLNRFGAVYTTLKYSPEWDRQWHIGPFADIVVTFDNSPVNMIFWHGTAYGAIWATENDKLMADQSLERSNSGKSKWGCSEHMSDKQCRYSRISLIENNPARVVVHWRYAVSDIKYEIFGIKENNDPFGEWADEYYYIYPDGVSTRYQVLYTKNLSHEWQETIVLNQPGTRPEDNIELDAMTFANMKGQEHTYSWAKRPKRAKMKPDGANIQIVNLKSEYKPFIIFEPDNGIKLGEGGIEDWCHFPWWNHWPVSQLANDGRRTAVADRPAHSSLSQSIEESGSIHRDSENPDKYWAVTLIGMTNHRAGELAPLARSWNEPARVEEISKGFADKGYDNTQRAYVFEDQLGAGGKLNFELVANEENVVYNPAFVIKNWGTDQAKVFVNGKKQTDKKRCRVGYNNTLEGTDLIIWLEMNSSKPVQLEVRPEK